MHNLKINFSHPWLLLLLIPAIVLTLIPYFRLAKRYRRTRNRITSIVLHILVMVLSISALAGMSFSYQLTNDENEIIYLVDVSDSEESAKQKRDEFLELAIQDSQFDGYKVGVVTFGFNQVYAAPLTYQVDEVYEKYLEAELPDTSATDIAAALTYTKGLFSNPITAKIVLITDGKETDEDATTVIRSISSEGIKLDVAYVPSDVEDYDAQIVQVKFPDYHMVIGEEYSLEVTIESKSPSSAKLALFDYDDKMLEAAVDLIEGKQKITLPFTFLESGLHEMNIELQTSKAEALEQNNSYCAYYYLEVFNKILVIESEEGASTKFVNWLNGDEEYEIEVKNILAADMPASVAELRAYDQIVLNNISNDDLVNKCVVENFDEKLNEYVNKYGGGLFTIGGSEEKTVTTNGETETVSVAHAYSREDMYGSLYQQMLPVQAINYTPPLGVVFCLDTSGSMGSPTKTDGRIKLDAAKDGMTACLSSLTERDYLGIITFDDYQSTILEMTPRIQESKIRAAISSIGKANASTQLSDAIDRAGQMLKALESVDKRHIVIISDGLTGDTQKVVEIVTDLNKNSGITVSVVGIDMSGEGSTGYKLAKAITDAGNGRVVQASGEELTAKMREELNVSEIKEVNLETFNPTIVDILSPLVQDLDRLTAEDGTVDIDKLSVSLDGFYGVKVRTNANLILTGEYNIPLYAQWKYGEGTVGSFMCDLDGTWSSSFMKDKNGQLFIKNVINNLMPLSNIRPSDIVVDMTEGNYINKLSIVYEKWNEGDTVKGEVIDTASGEVVAKLHEKADSTTDWNQSPCYVTLPLNATNNYSRCDFVVRESGTYQVVISRYDSSGKMVSSVDFYKSFAYSQEYDSFASAEEEISPLMKLEDLAARSGGKVIADLDNPSEIFDGFVTDIDKTYDPRVLFMILAIVFFLLDIAVRKFKFKWPHELIRQYKEKRREKQDRQQ